MQVPGPRCQLVENVGLERREVPAGPLQAVHQLVLPHPVDGTRRGGQRGHQDQAGGIGGVAVAVGFIDHLHLSITAMGDVVGDCLTQAGVDRAHL